MWANPIVRAVLRSPFHRVMSGSTMMITAKGRKSGKEYTTPVNYLRDGEDLLTVSLRGRTWWRNLRGGASVILRLQGQEKRAVAHVAEDDDAVATGLAAVVAAAPAYARYLKIRLDESGRPDPGDLKRAAKDHVFVRTHLTE